MEPTKESSSEGNDNPKRNSVSESTTKSDSEFLRSDSESDFELEYACDVCDKRFSGLKPLRQHEKSGKHLKELRKQKLKKDIEIDEKEDDLSDDDFSLDKYQIYKECEVCNKEFNGPESYRSHIRSKGHKKKMDNYKILEMSKVDGKVNVDKLKQVLKMGSSPLGASAVSDSSESDEDSSTDVYKCEICKKKFSGLEPLRDHLTSKTHRKTQKQMKLVQNLSFNDPGNTIEIVDGDLFCKLCRNSFSGPENALTHLKGKGHLEWIEFKKWKKERKNSERPEPELDSEASTSAEPSEEVATNDKEPPESTDVNKSPETNEENKNISSTARIAYKTTRI